MSRERFDGYNDGYNDGIDYGNPYAWEREEARDARDADERDCAGIFALGATDLERLAATSLSAAASRQILAMTDDPWIGYTWGDKPPF